MSGSRPQLPTWNQLVAAHSVRSAVFDDFMLGAGAQKDTYEVQDVTSKESPTQTENENQDGSDGGDTYRGVIKAPTTNSDRPRAQKIGYCKEKETLAILFRDGTLIGYYGVPKQLWYNLKHTDSTGKFLRYSGLDDHPDKGPLDTGSMTDESRAKFGV